MQFVKNLLRWSPVDTPADLLMKMMFEGLKNYLIPAVFFVHFLYSWKEFYYNAQ